MAPARYTEKSKPSAAVVSAKGASVRWNVTYVNIAICVKRTQKPAAYVPRSGLLVRWAASDPVRERWDVPEDESRGDLSARRRRNNRTAHMKLSRPMARKLARQPTAAAT